MSRTTRSSSATRETLVLYDAFHSGYYLTPSGEVERAEVITEFRRAVLIVREHADFGEYPFNETSLARALGP